MITLLQLFQLQACLCNNRIRYKYGDTQRLNYNLDKSLQQVQLLYHVFFFFWFGFEKTYVLDLAWFILII